jgi:hypothetical protein
MDPTMYAKAIASIREFGFVDPVTVRENGLQYEIIDGEHRWRAAIDENLDPIPAVNLGVVPDEVAKQLTIVLNETRGSADPNKLGELLRDLSSRVSKESLLSTLPYSREAFERLTGSVSFDWSGIGTTPEKPPAGRVAAWVERTYRMPAESAEVLDRAIAHFREMEDDGTGRVPDWKVLELLAADYLGS